MSVFNVIPQKVVSTMTPVINSISKLTAKKGNPPTPQQLAAMAKPSAYALPAYPKQGNVLKPLFSSADIFSAENAVIQKADKGDDLYVSIYEIQNALVNGGTRTSKGVAGYDEQQQLVPNMLAASERGANVHIVLDHSIGFGKPSENNPLIRFMKKTKIDIRPYPTKLAKINHCKNMVLVHHTPQGATEYWGMGGGGMNMGNHSAANHDSMILMAGVAPYNMLVQVIRPQLAVCKDDVSKIPTQVEDDPEVQWLNTAPPEENNGKAQDDIKKAYMALLRKSVELSAKGFTPHVRAAQFVLSNPAAAYFLRDAALAGAQVDILLDPSLYAQQVAARGERAKWARKVLESGGLNLKFYNTDRSIQQRFHDKWISLSYTDATGKEIPVELITGSANASKSGLEPSAPKGWYGWHDVPASAKKQQHTTGFAALMNNVGKRMPGGALKNYFVALGKTNPSDPAKLKFYRRNREADARILNLDVIKAYNDRFDKMMATNSVNEPPPGSGDDENI